MIEAVLFSYLSNNTELIALIDKRIYPLLMSQDGSFPQVVYTIVNNRELQSMNHREPYGFDVRVQIDCYDKDFDDVLALKEAVRNAMHDFTHKAHGFNSRTMPYDPDTQLYRQLIEFNLKG